MKDLFWLDGVCCEDVGVTLQGPIEFEEPTPRISTTQVPGRNGDLIFFEGAFDNIMATARCFVLHENADVTLHQITKWMLLPQKYRRLETTDEPDCYRLACITNGPETAIRVRLLAPFSIEFNCKPQKFLKSGEYALQVENHSKLYNPGFPALPIITIYGSAAGSLQIGEYAVTVKDIDEYVILDCETQNAYKETLNKNNTIYAPEFPRLGAGENIISWNGGISEVEVTPRWWTL